MGGCDLVEKMPAATSDDHLIASVMEFDFVSILQRLHTGVAGWPAEFGYARRPS
jgi:hypothetical protein